MFYLLYFLGFDGLGDLPGNDARISAYYIGDGSLEVRAGFWTFSMRSKTLFLVALSHMCSAWCAPPLAVLTTGYLQFALQQWSWIYSTTIIFTFTETLIRESAPDSSVCVRLQEPADLEFRSVQKSTTAELHDFRWDFLDMHLNPYWNASA